jgi:hypothetical protein
MSRSATSVVTCALAATSLGYAIIVSTGSIDVAAPPSGITLAQVRQNAITRLGIPSDSITGLFLGATTMQTLIVSWYQNGGDSSWDPAETVFVAAILAPRLNIDLVVEPPTLEIFSPSGALYRVPRSVAGGYSVWSQSTGELRAEGVLEHDGFYRIDTLRSLVLHHDQGMLQ